MRLALLVSCSIAACGTAPSAPDLPPETDAPAQTFFELRIDRTAESMQAIHDALPPGPMRAALLMTASDWIDAVAPLDGEIAARIDDDAPVRVIAIASSIGEEPPALAVASRVRTGGLHTIADPSLRHARWLGARPASRDAIQLALTGDVIVAAEDRATLDRSLAYLATRAMATPAPGGIHAHLPSSVMPRLRNALDAWIERSSSSALRSARAERAAHHESPALGDPEALVAIVRDAALRRTAYVPDAAELDATLRAGDHGVELSIDVSVRDSTPLARAIDEAAVLRPTLFERLPIGTALAWADASRADERSNAARELGELIQRLAGARLGEEDRAAIDAALSAWAAASGEVSAGLFGRIESTSFAGILTLDAGQLDPALAERAVRTAYAAGALSTLLGCEQSSAGGLADQALPLCASPPSAIEIATDNRARALVLRRGQGPIATRIASGDGESLGGAPDVARERSLFAQEAIFALLVVPSRLWGAASLSGHPALERVAAQPSLRERDAPIVLAVRRTERGLHIEAHASAPALADLVSTLEPLGTRD